MLPSIRSIKVLLVDDQAAFVSLITLLLHEIDIMDVQVAQNAQQGIARYKAHNPDICLLDIDLGKGQPSGIDLADEIRALNPQVPIIFLTSHYSDDYYEKVRHIRPSSFMNKELSKLKLYQSIDLALMQASAKATSPVVQTPPIYFHSAPSEHLFFKIGDAFKQININEVSYFYSKDKLTYARVGNRNYPTSVQLKILEEELDSHFVRIHKGYLVNIKSIDSINTNENYIQIDKEKLPIGHVYRKPFLEKIKLLK